MNFKYVALAGLAAVFLSACGGGGSSSAPSASSAPPPVVVVPPPYTLTPGSIDVAAVAGYSASINLIAKQTVPFVGIAYMLVVPDAPVIDPVITVKPQADGTFDVQAKTAASATAGQYSGNITISVCADAQCKSHLAGSPFKLPYSIDVIPPEGGVIAYDQRALTPLSGAPDWETFQGNAQHTGYVPVTLNAASFAPRWKWMAPAIDGTPIQPSTLVTGAGRFYISHGEYFSSGASAVTAYRESDGSKVWSHSFADLRFPSANPPAFSNGKLFIAAGSQGTSMFGFDAATGTQLFKSQMGSQWERYLAPTVFDGNVFTDGGTYGGLYSFAAATGAQNYFAGLPQYDGWTPAVDANNLYTFVAAELQVIDPRTGAMRARIPAVSQEFTGYTAGGAPVIGSGSTVFAGATSPFGPNAITAFDTATKSVRWTAQGSFPGNPGYADGLLFALNNTSGKLDVLKEADGTSAWSWAAPSAGEKFVSDVLVTKNLVFVSTDRMTYAIDRTSHASVWSYKASGKLALSPNGILYIKGASTIVAINL